MLRSNSRRLLLSLVIITPLILGSYYLLSGYNAAVSLFRTGLERSFALLEGWEIEAGDISGNPVFGFSATDLRVLFHGEEIARAERFTVGLSLLSLLRGQGAVGRVTINSGILSGERLLHALENTDFGSAVEGSGTSLPVIVFEPAEILTPMGSVSLNSLRLTPRDDTVTFYGQGRFLGAQIELGVSFITGDQLFITDAFFRGGDATVSLSGSVLPETNLEGYVDDFRLDFISELVNLPFSARGTLDSTLSIERPFGRLLAYGEGEIENGDIWDLVMDGPFSWSADSEKAVISPSTGASIYSSPVSGVFSLFFGETPSTEIALHLKDTSFEDWTRCFPWLSFARGSLSTLKLDLSGQFSRLKGLITFNTEEAVLQGFSVDNLLGRLVMTGEGTMKINGTASWASSAFSFDGESVFSDKDDRGTTLSLRANDFNLSGAGEIYAPALSARGSGALDLAISVPSNSSLVYSGRLSSDRASALGVPLANLSVVFNGTDEHITISSLSLSPGSSGVLTGSGSIDGAFGGSPTISVNGGGKGIRWSLLDENLGGLRLSGLLDASWSISGPAKSPVVTFALQGDDTPLSPLLPLKALNLKGRYEEEELHILNAAATLHGGEFRAEGGIHFQRDDMSLKGRFDSISSVALTASAFEGVDTLEGRIAGEFSLSGTPSSPSMRVTCTSPGLSIGSLLLEAPKVVLEGNTTSLKVVDFSAGLLGAKVKAAGVIGLAKGEVIDFGIELGALDLHDLARSYFPGLRLGGKLFSTFRIAGKAGDILEPTFSGAVPLLTAYGVLIDNALLSLSPKREGTLSLLISGKLGDTDIALEGEVTPKPEALMYTLKNSAAIDLKSTLPALSSQTSGLFKGFADFSISGTISESPSFSGSASSSSMSIYRLDMTDVSVPFEWDEGFLRIQEGSANYHKGKVAFEGKIDPSTMRFEGSATVMGLDLADASQGIFEGRGTISGSADLSIRGSGTGGMMGLVFGSGQLSVREGAFSGFESIKSISTSGEIPFSSLLASFNLDGRSVFLLPGSRLSAPPGNEAYRYFSASGSLGWGDSPLDLKCSGDINVRALNAFIGALQGFLTIDGNPLTDPQFLQRFLTGLVGGMAVKDFRETSFNLRGSWSSPEMSDLKVSSGNAPADIPYTNGGHGRNVENKIRITVEIPTGTGADNTASPEEQVKKQLIENILKTLIKPGTIEE